MRLDVSFNLNETADPDKALHLLKAVRDAYRKVVAEGEVEKPTATKPFEWSMSGTYNVGAFVASST